VLAGLAVVALGFVPSCGPDVPHDEGERFPLEGQHAALPCESCHLDGFDPIPSECASCHEDDRPTPDHNLGQDCGDCHTALGWGAFTGGTGNDHSFLPLQDAHDLSCSTCHGDTGGYDGLDATCRSCHADDEPPYHYIFSYTGDCVECHTPTVWADGENHDSNVPLPHHAAACSDCHVDPYDRLVFVCTECHGEAATEPLHGAVPGYQWDSAECFACHFESR
jgi:hypothetical protein